MDTSSCSSRGISQTSISCDSFVLYVGKAPQLLAVSYTDLQNHLGIHGYDILLPDVLFQPMKMAAVENIL